MVVSLRKLVLIGVVGAGVVACSKKTPEPTASMTTVAATPPPAAGKAAQDVGGDGKLDPNHPKPGTRKLTGLDAPVYVDGVQSAVLRFGELPAIPVTQLEGNGRLFQIYDYLKGIGVNPDTIKSIHFHGNADKIASIEGTELRKFKDRFTFSFV